MQERKQTIGPSLRLLFERLCHLTNRRLNKDRTGGKVESWWCNIYTLFFLILYS